MHIGRIINIRIIIRIINILYSSDLIKICSATAEAQGTARNGIPVSSQRVSCDHAPVDCPGCPTTLTCVSCTSEQRGPHANPLAALLEQLLHQRELKRTGQRPRHSHPSCRLSTHVRHDYCVSTFTTLALRACCIRSHIRRGRDREEDDMRTFSAEDHAAVRLEQEVLQSHSPLGVKRHIGER